jgi:hypothetical protein
LYSLIVLLVSQIRWEADGSGCDELKLQIITHKMNMNQLTHEPENKMLGVTEEDISKAEKLIQDISVDIDSTMQDFEENLSSVPKGKGISLLELDSIHLSKNRCMRKRCVRTIAEDNDSDSESDFGEDDEPSDYMYILQEEPVICQKARTFVQNKSNNKKKQTSRQRIRESLGPDSLHLNRNRLASPKREGRPLIARQTNTPSS